MYTLNLKETNSKSSKYHYTVTDETGNVITERKSNKIYAACTLNGQYFFGRLDLIGKGEHGQTIKQMIAAGRESEISPVVYLNVDHLHLVAHRQQVTDDYDYNENEIPLR